MLGFDIMKQAKEMADKLKDANEALRAKTIEVTVGGGVVSAVCNGKLELVSIKIDPEVVNPEEVNLLEDLIISAISEGQRRAMEMAKEEMGKAAGLPEGFNIPGLM